jgi:predicted RNA-binding Zn ribbon-like protein
MVSVTRQRQSPLKDDATMHAWQELGLLGEHLALQFVNTVDDPGKTREQSGVPDWPTMVDWAATASMIGPQERARLLSDTDGSGIADEVASLHVLREAAWAVLQAHATAQVADRVARDTLADQIRWALTEAELAWDGQAWRWQADLDVRGPAVLRARLALAIEDMLRAPDLARLRECGRCAALFLDHGRGKGRRWCRMETCGNRAKASRHRSRR